MKLPLLLTRHGRALLAGLAGIGICAPHAAEAPQPSAEELRKIASAVPTRAAATPAKARRLLVFTLCKGYYHVSIPYGAKAVELMGERTGAFQATTSNDIAMFEPERLKEFDGICLLSALGEFFLPDDLAQLPPEKQAEARQLDDRLKRGFFAWLRAGKGLAGVHGGSFAFPQSPEFAQALGALFESHPWNSTDKLAVRLDEPDHPLLAVFQGRGFEIIDEGYQFKDPYSRRLDRVLYSLDPSRMDLNRKGLRPDHDFGLCWVKRYGEGRVFYTALGHNSEEFWNPALLKHILDGLQFCLGDLAAPAEPRGQR